MARQNDNTELYRRLTSIQLLTLQTGTIFDTTTASAMAYGDIIVDLTDITNATAADPIFVIGDKGFETNALGAVPATTDCPLVYKNELAQTAGARVVEAQVISLGRIETSGMSYTPSRQSTPIDAADQVTPIGSIDGVLEMSGAFGLYGFNIENYQLMHGYIDRVQGTGTPTDPFQGMVGDPDQSEYSLLAVRMNFLRSDGKVGHVDYLNARITPQGTTQHNKSAPASYGVNISFSQSVKRLWTPT